MTTDTHKSKITITLSPDLIQQLDEHLDKQETGSRSGLIEDAVREWLQDQARAKLERQTEAYYTSLTKAEREEDKAWSKVASRSAQRLWDE